jgi:putative acetyltransferase
MIRKIHATEIPQAAALWLEASLLAHDFIAADFWRSKLEDMREVYLPNAETYVYSHQGELLGFYALYGDTLAAIFVRPAQQGNGIGRALLRHALARRARLKLTVYQANAKSVAFYEKAGFQIVGEQMDSHTGHPEWMMEWRVGKR